MTLILVIDDEPIIHQLVAHALVPLQCDLHFAENGRSGISQARLLKPELIITDVRMPELDGLAAVSEIRRDQPVPVIFISAHQDAAPEELPGGPTLFLTKPIDRQELADAISGLMAPNGVE